MMRTNEWNDEISRLWVTMDEWERKEVPDEYQYFKSTYHRYMFALLYTDGVIRRRLLGVSRRLYHNKILAKIWKDRIYTCINSDYFNSEETAELQKANEKLLELYSNMIK